MAHRRIALLAAPLLLAGGCWFPGGTPPEPPDGRAELDLSASAVGPSCTGYHCFYEVSVTVLNTGDAPTAGPLTVTFTDELSTYEVPADSCTAILAPQESCVVVDEATGDTSAPLELDVTVSDGETTASESFSLL